MSATPTHDSTKKPARGSITDVPRVAPGAFRRPVSVRVALESSD